MVENGRLDAGIPQLEEGLAQRKAIGISSARMFELALLAEAYGVADRIDEGLQALAEALDFADRTGEGFYLPRFTA